MRYTRKLSLEIPLTTKITLSIHFNFYAATIAAIGTGTRRFATRCRAGRNWPSSVYRP